MDVTEAKERARTGWSQGKYSALSEGLRPASHALAEACAVSAGQEVLDVAAGDGNFALACAREGASVVASDMAPGMVEKGRRRSEDEGYDVEWVEADAEDLPFEDGRFDCTGSVFGAMIAPRPEAAASELFRVTRPGNTVGMVTWTPESASIEMFEIGRKYAPPSDLPALEEWGREDVVRERFDGLANTIDMERRTMPWTGDSPEEFVATMEEHSPMQAAAKAQMPPDVYAQMREEFVDLARRWAGDDGPFSVDVEYLLIVARKRG
ncbi:MAG TPA: class I SAM-dependent methyltransferase [Thermoleophilaceae bacterium]|nr:class I SAM-dependent methyltransferase [Thermoleophilaceae bacterium]